MKIARLVLALVLITVILSSSLINPGSSRNITNRPDYSYQDTAKPKHKSDSTNKKMSNKKHGDSTKKKADSTQKKYPG